MKYDCTATSSKINYKKTAKGCLFVKIETPCLVIDYETMARNIERMALLSKNSGCKLRPHTKTHKSPRVAKMQLEAGACGITVAKLGEAEVMAENGIGDIFVAYPVIGEGKVKRVLELNRKIRLIVGADSLKGAKELAEAAFSDGQVIEVRMEVDTGMRRTGVPYGKAVDFAKAISGYQGIRLTGIFTFKGLVYEGKATLDREKAGLEEGMLMSELAAKLRKEGIPIEDVSVGSTPTAAYAAGVPGVTEIRPGTYVYNDIMTANLGVCALEDCAASVLTTVVSRPADDYVVIDGGNKTFSTDAALEAFPYHLKGYGRIMQDERLILAKLSEEHGTIKTAEAGIGLKIGDIISIIPNHVCTTVNLHDRAYLLRNGRITEELPIAARGRVY